MARFGDSLPALDVLVYRALRDGLPERVTVARDLEENSADDLPFVMFEVTAVGAPENMKGVWPCEVTIWVFALTDRDAFELANEVYRVAQTWRQTTHVPGHGGIRFRGVSVPFVASAGASTVMIGKPVRQWVGGFDLLALEEPFFE